MGVLETALIGGAAAAGGWLIWKRVNDTDLRGAGAGELVARVGTGVADQVGSVTETSGRVAGAIIRGGGGLAARTAGATVSVAGAVVSKVTPGTSKESSDEQTTTENVAAKKTAAEKTATKKTPAKKTPRRRPREEDRSEEDRREEDRRQEDLGRSRVADGLIEHGPVSLLDLIGRERRPRREFMRATPTVQRLAAGTWPPGHLGSVGCRRPRLAGGPRGRLSRPHSCTDHHAARRATAGPGEALIARHLNDRARLGITRRLSNRARNVAASSRRSTCPHPGGASSWSCCNRACFVLRRTKRSTPEAEGVRTGGRPWRGSRRRREGSLRSPCGRGPTAGRSLRRRPGLRPGGPTPSAIGVPTPKSIGRILRSHRRRVCGAARRR